MEAFFYWGEIRRVDGMKACLCVSGREGGQTYAIFLIGADVCDSPPTTACGVHPPTPTEEWEAAQKLFE